jgi:tRNA dimethylallyltransferase
MIKVVVIAGPTASGKTALAIRLAQKFDGEIVSADSMQVYKTLDIATAKPSKEKLEAVPHHLIDVLEPTEEFSAYKFVTLAKAAIADITARGKLPIICGGTGLYIHSLIDGFSFKDDTPNSPTEYNPLKLALNFSSRELLYDKINARVDQMFDAGLVAEAKYALSLDLPTSAAAIGYKELALYFAEKQSLADAKALIKQKTRNYAKRQLTWFRPRGYTWLDADDKAAAFDAAEKAVNCLLTNS